jgi:hypothetical protein
MADYQIQYTDPFGNQKAVFTIDDFISLEYGKKEGEVGSLYIDFPPIFKTGFFVPEGRFYVYRRMNSGIFELDMDTVWFIRLIRYKTDEQGKRYIHILAHDAIEIIDRRIVAYNADTPYSDKTGNADSVIKLIMRENFGDLCEDTWRNISDYLLIDKDAGVAPSITIKDLARRKILPIFQEICAMSKEKGMYLTFDLSPIDEELQFKTYVGQRGVNRGSNSKSPLVLTMESDTLSYASIADDHTDEYNFIYAGGTGVKNNRVIKTLYDNKLMAISPYNRCEDFISAGTSEDQTDEDIDNLCKSRLSETRPKIVLNGHIQQSKDCSYGVHYGFGDIITIVYNGISLDVHIDTVSIKVDTNGKETITVYGRNLDDGEY